jgi:hypothetical protein
MDGGGAIDAEEFNLMLEVMGCQIDTAQVREPRGWVWTLYHLSRSTGARDLPQVNAVMGEAKEGFAEWLRLADEENIAKCRKVFDEFDDDDSGTMDLQEINAVISKLASMGVCGTSHAGYNIVRRGSDLSCDRLRSSPCSGRK